MCFIMVLLWGSSILNTCNLATRGGEGHSVEDGGNEWFSVGDFFGVYTISGQISSREHEHHPGNITRGGHRKY